MKNKKITIISIIILLSIILTACNSIDNNNESISTKNIEKAVENVKNEEKKVEVEDIKKLKEEITSKMDTLKELTIKFII